MEVGKASSSKSSPKAKACSGKGSPKGGTARQSRSHSPTGQAAEGCAWCGDLGELRQAGPKAWLCEGPIRPQDMLCKQCNLAFGILWDLKEESNRTLKVLELLTQAKILTYRGPERTPAPNPGRKPLCCTWCASQCNSEVRVAGPWGLLEGPIRPQDPVCPLCALAVSLLQGLKAESQAPDPNSKQEVIAILMRARHLIHPQPLRSHAC